MKNSAGIFAAMFNLGLSRQCAKMVSSFDLAGVGSPECAAISAWLARRRSPQLSKSKRILRRSAPAYVRPRAPQWRAHSHTSVEGPRLIQRVAPQTHGLRSAAGTMICTASMDCLSLSSRRLGFMMQNRAVSDSFGRVLRDALSDSSASRCARRNACKESRAV
jgi:hypothetical protein